MEKGLPKFLFLLLPIVKKECKYSPLHVGTLSGKGNAPKKGKKIDVQIAVKGKKTPNLPRVRRVDIGKETVKFVFLEQESAEFLFGPDIDTFVHLCFVSPPPLLPSSTSPPSTSPPSLPKSEQKRQIRFTYLLPWYCPFFCL